MNSYLIKTMMSPTVPESSRTEEKPLMAHAIDIATNFLNEVWRTHTTVPSVNVANLLEQQDYCVDAALRLCRVGRGNVNALYSKDESIQGHLAKAAVGAVAHSWKMQPNARKLKHVMKGVRSNLKSLKLDDSFCPPVNPPAPMKWEHEYLCPPVAIVAPMPNLAPETPIAGRDIDYFDETAEANDLAYEEALRDQSSYESAFWENTRELEQQKVVSKPVKLEPVTPIIEEKLEVLSPIKRPTAVAATAPICNISLAWLKEFSADNSVELRDNSTFLAFPDSHLDGFNKWSEEKTAAEIRTVKQGMIKSRLSHETQRGVRKFNLATLSKVTHRIEDGAVVSDSGRSQIFPSERQINGKRVLVLASEHPF